MANSQFEDILRKKAQGYKPSVPADLLTSIKAATATGTAGAAGGAAGVVKTVVAKLTGSVLTKIVATVLTIGSAGYVVFDNVLENNSSVKNEIVNSKEEELIKEETKVLNETQIDSDKVLVVEQNNSLNKVNESENKVNKDIVNSISQEADYKEDEISANVQDDIIASHSSKEDSNPTKELGNGTLSSGLNGKEKNLDKAEDNIINNDSESIDKEPSDEGKNVGAVLSEGESISKSKPTIENGDSAGKANTYAAQAAIYNSSSLNEVDEVRTEDRAASAFSESDEIEFVSDKESEKPISEKQDNNERGDSAKNVSQLNNGIKELDQAQIDTSINEEKKGVLLIKGNEDKVSNINVDKKGLDESNWNAELEENREESHVQAENDYPESEVENVPERKAASNKIAVLNENVDVANKKPSDESISSKDIKENALKEEQDLVNEYEQNEGADNLVLASVNEIEKPKEQHVNTNHVEGSSVKSSHADEVKQLPIDDNIVAVGNEEKIDISAESESKKSMLSSVLSPFKGNSSNEKRGKKLDIFKVEPSNENGVVKQGKFSLNPYVKAGTSILLKEKETRLGLSETRKGSFAGGGLSLIYDLSQKSALGIEGAYQKVTLSSNYYSSEVLDGTIDQDLSVISLKLGGEYRLFNVNKISFWGGTYWGGSYKLDHISKLEGKYFEQAFNVDLKHQNTLSIVGDVRLRVRYKFSRKIALDVSMISEYLNIMDESNLINIGGQLGLIIKL